MKKSEQFDRNDAALVSIYDDLPLWSAPFGLTLLETVRLRKSICALDIGFGTGFPLLEIAERLGESSSVYGIDPWEAAHQRTRLKIEKREIRNVRLFLGVAEEMPFGDSMFDLMFSNNGLNNVQDLTRALSESFRVGKPGAQMVATWNLPGTMGEFYELYEGILRRSGRADCVEKLKAHIHEKRKPVDFMTRSVKEAGFEIENVQERAFEMRFADSRALLDCFLIRLAFLETWKEVVPADSRNEVFSQVEMELDGIADRTGEIRLTIPYAWIDATRKP
jgi:ubiquinone/menaquinone biosynthesis C-methylase UbiE